MKDFHPRVVETEAMTFRVNTCPQSQRSAALGLISPQRGQSTDAFSSVHSALPMKESSRVAELALHCQLLQAGFHT